MPSVKAAIGRSVSSRRLVLITCLYVVVVLGVAVLMQLSAAGERKDLQRRVDARIDTTSEFIASYVTDQQQRQVTLAQRRLAGPIDQTDFAELSTDQGFRAAVLLDGDGRVLASFPASGRGAETLWTDRYDYLRKAVETGRSTVSGVVTDPTGDLPPMVGVAVPFDTPDGHRRVFGSAYLAAETPLQTYLTNLSSLPGHETYVVDTAGAVVSSGGVAAGATLPAANPPLAQAVTLAGSGRIEARGVPTFFAAAEVAGAPWRLVFATPTSSLFATVGGAFAWVKYAVLAGFAVTGLLSLVTSSRYRILSRRRARSDARSEVILASTPEAYIGVDDRGVITDWNPAATALLGWEAAEAIGRPAIEVHIPEELHDLFQQYLSGELELPPTPMEYTVRHADGHQIPVEAVIARLPGLSGWRYHAFLRDLTPRLAAEGELRRLAAIIDATGDAVMSTAADGTVTSWNPASEQLYGYQAEEMIGRNFRCLIPPDRTAETLDVIRRVNVGEAVGPFETVHLRKSGSEVEVSLSVAPLLAAGDVVGACTIARDITQARRQAADLREAEERFRVAFDAVPVGMTLTSLDEADAGRLIRVNGGFCWMLGYTEEELCSRTLADITHPDDLAMERELLTPFYEGRQRTVRFEKRYLRSDGSTVWTMVSSAVVDGADGRPRYAVTQVEDITARRAEQERLTALALCDPLTGLANRMLFEDRLTQAVHRAGRHDGTVAVLYCDLDRFKPVNDEFGHAVGDELLRQVGHRLLVAMRPTDTVARLGGDEFAVICESLKDAEAALPLADRVRDAVEGTYLVSAGAVQIGCSVGVATAAGAGVEPRDLVRRADLSMFTDKRSKREQEPLASGTGTLKGGPA